MPTRANSRALLGIAAFALILTILFNAAAIYERIARPSPGAAFVVRWPDQPMRDSHDHD